MPTWLRNETDRSSAWLTDRGPAEPIEETDFVDNWEAALGQFIDEDLSISRYIHEGTAKRSRNKQIDTQRINGRYIKTYLPDTASYAELAEHAKNVLGVEIRTDEDIDNDIREELKYRKDYANDVFSRASTGGQVGRIAGTFHGAMLDPVTWPGMTVGVGAAANASSAFRAVGIAASINAGVAVAEEIPIQAAVYSWKKDIGSEYTVRDAINNISLAAGGAGTLGALGESLGRTIKAIRKTPDVPDEVREAVEHLQREVVNAPDLNGSAVKYLDEIEQRATKINSAKPHNGGHKPFDDLTDEALDAEYTKSFDIEPEAKVAPETRVAPETKVKPKPSMSADDPMAGIEVPTRYNATVDGLQVAETKPLRQVMDDLDVEEEKLLTLKACLGG